jgi:hypothetical protein
MTSTTNRSALSLPSQAWLVLALIVATGAVYAAGTTGTALQATYNMVNDMVGGYGKQLLTVLAFTFALIGYLASNATSVVLKFVGFAIFGSVGLTAATGIIGALV